MAGGHSALLEYVVGENNSYLFVLTKGAGRPMMLKVYPLGLKGKELGVLPLRREGGARAMTKAWALRAASLKLLHSQYNHPA